MIMTEQEKHDYETQLIIDAVNERLGTALTFDCWHAGPRSPAELFCKDSRGRPTVIVGSNTGHHQRRYIVRGVVRRKRKDRRWGFLINGQPGKNAVAVKGSGQGEGWLHVSLPTFVRLPGKGELVYVTPDEIERIGEDHDNPIQCPKGTRYGAKVTLRNGDVYRSNAPASFFRDETGLQLA